MVFSGESPRGHGGYVHSAPNLKIFVDFFCPKS